MLNSRDIGLLRADVAANCRLWLGLCKAAGLAVLVTSTVRDDEYQAFLYASGRSRPGAVITNSPVPTYHWVDAGLAFDFCKNVKGQEYSDLRFFSQAAEIAKRMGFEWGGDWVTFVDRPHLQWAGAGAGRVTGAQIRAGRRPPPMELYGGDELSLLQYEGLKTELAGIKASVDKLNIRLGWLEDIVKPAYSTVGEVPDWARDAVSDAVRRGIVAADADGRADWGAVKFGTPLSWGDVRVLVMAYRRERSGL